MAKDYIQDGLICLYDGIENQGFGKHMEGVRLPWIDCVSGTTYTGDRYVFYNNGVGLVQTYGDKIPFPDGVSTQTEWTIEYVAKLGVNLGTNNSFIRGAEGTYVFYPYLISYGENSRIYAGNYSEGSGMLSIPNLNNNTTYAVWRMSTNPIRMAGLAVLGNDISFIRGRTAWGQLGVTGVVTADYTMNEGFVCRIKCIRVYNRGLTDDEIAYNYSIDCERFEL